MSIIAIGDIHGCAATLLQSALDTLAPNRDDLIVTMGDLIDRGPDSKGVLDILMNLCADGYQVVPLRGNHEDMLLKAAGGDFAWNWLWKRNGGDKALKSFDAGTVNDIPDLYLEFMCSMPLHHFAGNYLFVHAGLDFTLASPTTDIDFQTYSSDDSEYLTALWSRDTYFDQDKLGGLTLVTGHTIVPEEDALASLNSQHIQIDTGCCAGKGLTVCRLDGETREMMLFPSIDNSSQNVNNATY